MKLYLPVTLMAAFGAVLCGQNGKTFDSSGNGLLKGTYNFRHLAATALDSNGNPTEVTATSGVINFDGKGNYSLAGSYVDNTIAKGAPQNINVISCAAGKAPCGNYAIGGNGLGFIANPLAPGDVSNVIRGAVAQGVFAGSDTEGSRLGCLANPSNNCSDFDVFVAIPTGSLASNASLTATYQMAVLDFAGGDSATINNAIGNLSPDGKGGIGTMFLTGQASNQASAGSLQQYVTGATYQVNGDSSVTLTLQAPVGVAAADSLFLGTRTMFVSADGNFVLGWNPSGFDIFVGIQVPAQPATQSNTQGLYFIGGLEDSPAGAGVDSFYGSISGSGDSNGDAIVHQRLKSPWFFPYDYVSDDQILLNAGNVGSDYNGYQYAFGPNGAALRRHRQSGALQSDRGIAGSQFQQAGSFSESDRRGERGQLRSGYRQPGARRTADIVRLQSRLGAQKLTGRPGVPNQPRGRAGADQRNQVPDLLRESDPAVGHRSL